MYRGEPSFRAPRFGNGLAPDFLTGEEPSMVVISTALADIFVTTHAVDMSEDMLHYI